MNQPFINIYSLFLGFLFHLGHHRALRSVHCAVHTSGSQSSALYTVLYVYVSPNLTIHTPPLSPLVTITLFSTSVSVSALYIQFSSVQSLSLLQLFVTP